MYVSWVYYITLATGKQTQVSQDKENVLWLDFRTFNFAVHFEWINWQTEKFALVFSMWVWICFSLCYVARFVEPEIGDYFFPFFMDFIFWSAQDLRHDDHKEDKFRPNNTPDWHFFVWWIRFHQRGGDHILGSSGRVLLISDPPRSWQHNLEALDHIDLYQLVLSNLFKELS